jgi:hypothetical protein
LQVVQLLMPVSATATHTELTKLVPATGWVHGWGSRLPLAPVVAAWATAVSDTRTSDCAAVMPEPGVTLGDAVNTVAAPKQKLEWGQGITRSERAVTAVRLPAMLHPAATSLQADTADPEAVLVVPLGHGSGTALLDQLPGE